MVQSSMRFHYESEVGIVFLYVAERGMSNSTVLMRSPLLTLV